MAVQLLLCGVLLPGLVQNFGRVDTAIWMHYMDAD